MVRKYMTAFETFFVSAMMRHIWLRYPERLKALNRAKYETKVGNRRRVFWKCEMCGKAGLTRYEVQVDHINPRVDPEVGWVDLPTAIERTFVTADELCIACLPCHKAKSKDENVIRRKVK
jgi:hypothetical protein